MNYFKNCKLIFGWSQIKLQYHTTLHVLNKYLEHTIVWVLIKVSKSKKVSNPKSDKNQKVPKNQYILVQNK